MKDQQVNSGTEQELDTCIVNYFLMETFTLRSWIYVNLQFTNSSDQGPYHNRHS